MLDCILFVFNAENIRNDFQRTQWRLTNIGITTIFVTDEGNQRKSLMVDAQQLFHIYSPLCSRALLR